MNMWELWRQDDHGNTFLVQAFTDREAAELVHDEMTARGHHQHFCVQPEPEDTQPATDSQRA